jgi:hypothetical protein
LPFDDLIVTNEKIAAILPRTMNRGFASDEEDVDDIDAVAKFVCWLSGNERRTILHPDILMRAEYKLNVRTESNESPNESRRFLLPVNINKLAVNKNPYIESAHKMYLGIMALVFWPMKYTKSQIVESGDGE